jgi:arginine-tRNA-protein transferase
MRSRRGWRHEAVTAEEYAAGFLAGEWDFAREFRYWQDGRLVGIGLVDETPSALSSVYFYHDPAWRPQAPGTFSALQEIAYARNTGRRWLYLGYWIAACQSMAYKANFRPHQILDQYVEDEATPAWD